MKYNLAIFDLDGTILNTLQDLTDSVNYVLKKHGFPLRSNVEIRRFLGNGALNLIEKSVPENCPENIFNNVFTQYIEYYSLHSNDKTMPYHGIIDVIKELRANDVKIAVISNKQDSEVKRLCQMHFDKLIDYVTGERENTPKKPDPCAVLETINSFAIDKNKCIFIGDSEIDIITAKNANIDSIAVTWGFRDKEILEGYYPTYFADNAYEIINIIK